MIIREAGPIKRASIALPPAHFLPRTACQERQDTCCTATEGRAAKNAAMVEAMKAFTPPHRGASSRLAPIAGVRKKHIYSSNTTASACDSVGGNMLVMEKQK